MPRKTQPPLIMAALAQKRAKAIRILRYTPNQVLAAHTRTRDTALHLFVENEAETVVEALLKAGASVAATNARLDQPLHLARSAAVVQLLLAHGAKAFINCRNDYDFSPLLNLSRRGDIEAVRLLIEAGAEVNPIVITSGDRPLMRAAARLDVPLVELLVRSGADLHARDRAGRNALDHAIRSVRSSSKNTDAIALIRALASAGLYRPGSAKTVMEMPSHAQDFRDILELLIHNSAFDPSTMVPGSSYKTASLFWGHSLAVLLRHGLDPNIVDTSGESLASRLASSMAQVSMWSGTLLLLIVAGLDLHTITKRGAEETILQIVKRTWPEVSWDAPRGVVRQQCAAIFVSHKEWQPSVVQGLMLHKIP